ncbi:hypothetical protein FC756_12305 [Lysinibacillus mangiferihumi]|uniref:Uncharacterized protein n=1 Tax=Lysinibacillus mangiferihumi TaxID=1130819 RepID=A0A4U2Z1B5_9BACI|nr:hypothetical protein [Lysinibacillus mangiferihumi]TKI67819.1 hypothetical protein FC756_12305 [Lysinibacillus mangiferihumi]
MANVVEKGLLSDGEIEEIIKKIKPMIEYGLLQTTPENRDDLRQHLYELSIKTLKNVRLMEPQGLFN